MRRGANVILGVPRQGDKGVHMVRVIGGPGDI